MTVTFSVPQSIAMEIKADPSAYTVAPKVIFQGLNPHAMADLNVNPTHYHVSANSTYWESVRGLESMSTELAKTRSMLDEAKLGPSQSRPTAPSRDLVEAVKNILMLI